MSFYFYDATKETQNLGEAEAPSGPPADGLHPSGRPLTNSEYIEKYFTKINLDEMESQFKKDSWVWIGGLKGAKELNGTLGQIVKFNEEKQRYQVFIPGVDSNGFNFDENSVSSAILAKKQDDAKIRKLFQWKDETTSTGCHMKLIKVENLKGYEGKLVECQYVEPGHPFGRVKSVGYPEEHPMFTVSFGNTPVLNRCGFPLVIVRYPYNRQIRPRSHYDNQFATYMLINVLSGFAPPEWQSYVGPVLAYRPQTEDQYVQHFSSLDFEIVWDFLSGILDQFGEDEIPLPDRDFRFEKLRDFTKNYCLNYQGTKKQNITRGAPVVDMRSFLRDRSHDKDSFKSPVVFLGHGQV